MIVCPACGLKNPDSAPHCDCGRALAAGAVDRGATVHAAVRGGRGWLREGAARIRAHWLRSIATTVALGLIAYGLMRWRHGPAHRARLAVQELCGDRFKEHLAATGSGVAVAGCYVYRDGRLGAAAVSGRCRASQRCQNRRSFAVPVRSSASRSANAVRAA